MWIVYVILTPIESYLAHTYIVFTKLFYGFCSQNDAQTRVQKPRFLRYVFCERAPQVIPENDDKKLQRTVFGGWKKFCTEFEQIYGKKIDYIRDPVQ